MAQQRIIWFGIVMSSVIYLVLAYVMAPEASGDFDTKAATPPVPVLYGAALAVFVVAWFMAPKLVRDNPNANARLIVPLALFEACAIFGLVAAFLVQDWRLYLAPWALAIAGFIRERPRESSRTAP